MVEILLMAQLVRNPLLALRWWCKSLFGATHGQQRIALSAQNRDSRFQRHYCVRRGQFVIRVALSHSARPEFSHEHYFPGPMAGIADRRVA